MTPIPYGVVDAYFRKYLLNNPSWGIILGSGWDIIDSDFTVEHKIPYHQLSFFPAPTIPGHKGELIIGKLGKTPLIILSGRSHLYEGYSPEEIVSPIRILARFGIKKLIITNAAGAINPDFQVGDIMLIKDQINLQFKSFLKEPQINPVRSGGCLEEIEMRKFITKSIGASNGVNIHPAPESVRGKDLHRLYDNYLLTIAERVARAMKISVRKGVYVGVTGPSYETAAEIRMFRKIGGDAVGMSTVFETTAAVQSGMKVLGISCLVNKATGLSDTPLEHQQVLRVMEKVKNQLNRLIKNVVLGSE